MLVTELPECLLDAVAAWTCAMHRQSATRLARAARGFIEPGRRALLRQLDIEATRHPDRLVAFLRANPRAATFVQRLAFDLPERSDESVIEWASELVALTRRTVTSLDIRSDEQGAARLLSAADGEAAASLVRLSVHLRQVGPTLEMMAAADFGEGWARPRRCRASEATVATALSSLLQRSAATLAELDLDVRGIDPCDPPPAFTPSISVPPSLPRLRSISMSSIDDATERAVCAAAGTVQTLEVDLSGPLVRGLSDEVARSVVKLGRRGRGLRTASSRDGLDFRRFVSLRELHLAGDLFLSSYPTLPSSLETLTAHIPSLGNSDAAQVVDDIFGRLRAGWLPRLSRLSLTYKAHLWQEVEALASACRAHRPELEVVAVAS